MAVHSRCLHVAPIQRVDNSDQILVGVLISLKFTREEEENEELCSDDSESEASRILYSNF